MTLSAPNSGWVARGLAGVAGALALLLPSAPVMAADDPGPASWPKVERSASGGSHADPAPLTWATIAPPQNGGSNSDPKPPTWPKPQPG